MMATRRVMVGLGLAFGAYFALRALWWSSPVEHPVMLIGATGLTAVMMVLCIFLEPHRLDSERPHPAPISGGAGGPTRLPAWAGWLAVATAALVPTVVNIAVTPEQRLASFATVHIGSLSALLVVVVVRRRAALAWAGVAALSIATIVWLGPLVAFAQGLNGAVMWVLGAQLLLRSMDRLARDSQRLLELQHAAIAWRTKHGVRRRERRERVRFTLTVAGPIMQRVIETGGHLDAAERLQARVAEGALRDELRGGALLDDRVRAALNDARARGINVTVLDDGPLVIEDAAQLDRIRDTLARTVREAEAERLIVRASASQTAAITVVGRAHADGAESVTVWQEIPRHAEAEDRQEG